MFLHICCVRGVECTCESCGRTYEYERGKGGTQARCNSCCVNDRRFKLKLKIIEYLGGCCKRCGYDRCPVALEAHHLDPATKEFAISGSHCRSWTAIEAELDKCELLCSNCHRETEFEGSRFQQFLDGG